MHAADPADTDADRHALRTLRLTRVEGARDAGVGQTLNWQMHFSAESGAGRWPDIPVLLPPSSVTPNIVFVFVLAFLRVAPRSSE